MGNSDNSCHERPSSADFNTRTGPVTPSPMSIATRMNVPSLRTCMGRVSTKSIAWEDHVLPPSVDLDTSVGCLT